MYYILHSIVQSSSDPSTIQKNQQISTIKFSNSVFVYLHLTLKVQNLLTACLEFKAKFLKISRLLPKVRFKIKMSNTNSIK